MFYRASRLGSGFIGPSSYSCFIILFTSFPTSDIPRQESTLSPKALLLTRICSILQSPPCPCAGAGGTIEQINK